ncbi:hypothetical protein PS417_09865 [Pseudomonas simiae]|uniref:Uncharacterized protein n=1 Tax=Pseudomonas simiae TaxID=321846 RepID=A0A1N7TWE2_9PSED|nr:hypothetical protein PS417_09865 [Pseudomonas simiae]
MLTMSVFDIIKIQLIMRFEGAIFQIARCDFFPTTKNKQSIHNLRQIEDMTCRATCKTSWARKFFKSPKAYLRLIRTRMLIIHFTQ